MSLPRSGGDASGEGAPASPLPVVVPASSPGAAGEPLVLPPHAASAHHTTPTYAKLRTTNPPSPRLRLARYERRAWIAKAEIRFSRDDSASERSRAATVKVIAFRTITARGEASRRRGPSSRVRTRGEPCCSSSRRSEEHTSELQSRQYLVCRLLLEKKKINTISDI